MLTAGRTKQPRGRSTTSSLRLLLAACVALLLTASNLGQAAHFLLVPHAVCAEHGELLELTEQSGHRAEAREHAADGSRETRAAQPEALLDHDHCQVLIRGQREQSLPQPGSVALLPAAEAEKLAIFSASSALRRPLSTLALAPKTSPPRSAGC